MELLTKEDFQFLMHYIITIFYFTLTVTVEEYKNLKITMTQLNSFVRNIIVLSSISSKSAGGHKFKSSINFTYIIELQYCSNFLVIDKFSNWHDGVEGLINSPTPHLL